MLKWFFRIFTNTNSRSWRTYEFASSVAFLILFTCVVVFLMGDKTEFAWTVKVLIWTTSGIVFVDVLKYKLTGSAKDKPLRKWFSFRWAQRYRPGEILILPNNFVGEVKDLRYSRCNSCGAFHGFVSEDGVTERVCAFRGCKEVVVSSDEYAQGTSEKFRKKEERSAIFTEVRLSPFRFFYRYSWVIAEHIFKLFSWMLIACAVLAAGQHLVNDVIEYAGIFLCVLWVMNFVVICFRTMTFVQDEMIQWSNKDEENRIIKQGIAFSVSMILVVAMWQIIVVTLSIFSEVYSNVKLF